jgi:dTMP kinase
MYIVDKVKGQEQNAKWLADNDYNLAIEVAQGHRKSKNIFLDVKIAFKRIELRADNNRYEQMNRGFHQKVRDGFLKIAQENTQRVVVIDGNQNPDIIFEQIKAKLG